MTKPKPKYLNSQGDCCLCGKVGSIEFHHIIPKSMGVVTDIRARFVCEVEENKIINAGGIPKLFRIEHMQIKVCPECHTILHMEFKKYRFLK